jgi:hypothetical protein
MKILNDVVPLLKVAYNDGGYMKSSPAQTLNNEQNFHGLFFIYRVVPRFFFALLILKFIVVLCRC